jgi:predicted dehydrogenase
MPAIAASPIDSRVHRPRIGFAGVGWIGLHRLKALVAAQAVEVVSVVDSSMESARIAVGAVRELSPEARVGASFDELLAEDLDGIVIATPSGLHAQQAMAALENGCAVFCQKPLARTAADASRTIAAARQRNRLLAVDFCYRTLAGVADVVRLIRSGALGEVYSADLVFHNAYGPDKSWFYDLSQSGGGCVMDLGIHLIDLLLWVLDYPAVREVQSRLHADGKLVQKPARELEDHAFAEVQFTNGCTARLACSWRLNAGRDAIIEASFYGTHGAAIIRNVRGSFYEFEVEHCQGTSRRVLAQGPDEWGGRAACHWARQLAVNPEFDVNAERLYEVSALIDAVYGR